MRILIKNGTIVNEGLSYKGSLLINGNIIEKILSEKDYTQKSGYEDALAKLEKVSENFKVDFVISVSVDESELAEEYKSKVIVSL